jgi:hypothetical protein
MKLSEIEALVIEYSEGISRYRLLKIEALIIKCKQCIKDSSKDTITNQDLIDINKRKQSLKDEIIRLIEISNLLTKHELWHWQCPSFNFEYDENELLEHALKVGFVTEHSDNQYRINLNY